MRGSTPSFLVSLAATMLASGLARAQVAENDDESPADRQASLNYEEALRADVLGKHLEAQQLAAQALAVSPDGRYAPAARRLLEHLTADALSEPARVSGDRALGSKIAYVLSGGILGGGTGFLLGIGSNTSLGAGISLVGIAVGVGATLLSTPAVHDGSAPVHLWSWGTYGAWMAGAAALLWNVDGSTAAKLIGVGAAVGGLLGSLLGTATDLTAADGLAGLVVGNQVLGDVLIFEIALAYSSLSPATIGATILALGTVGYVGGELLNHRIHWSPGRWGLILLSAVVGTAFASLPLLASVTSSGPAVATLLAAGSILGFTVGCVVTIGMHPDDARRPPIPVRGSPAAALLPAVPAGTLAWAF